jgi:hypothetical protein
MKGVKMKFGTHVSHDKTQLSDKGHYSESYIFGI